MPHLRREESASLELSSLCSLHTKRAKEGNTEIEVGDKEEGGEGTERVVEGREGEILFCNPQYLPLPTLQTALMCKNCQGWRRNRMEGMDDGAMETRFNNRFAEIQQSILLIE